MLWPRWCAPVSPAWKPKGQTAPVHNTADIKTRTKDQMKPVTGWGNKGQESITLPAAVLKIYIWGQVLCVQITQGSDTTCYKEGQHLPWCHKKVGLEAFEGGHSGLHSHLKPSSCKRWINKDVIFIQSYFSLHRSPQWFILACSVEQWDATEGFALWRSVCLGPSQGKRDACAASFSQKTSCTKCITSNWVGKLLLQHTHSV